MGLGPRMWIYINTSKVLFVRVQSKSKITQQDSNRNIAIFIMKFSTIILGATALFISQVSACAQAGHFCTNEGATDCECNGGHLVRLISCLLLVKTLMAA